MFSMIALESSLAGMNLKDSAVLIGPPMIVELFICVSLWFVCKSIHINKRNSFNKFLIHAISAAAVVALWLIFTLLYSEALDSLLKTQIWKERFDKVFPVLLVAGFFLYFLSCLFHYLALAHEEREQAEKQALENLLAANRAELNSLKATVHPHFLFNSLTALSTLSQTSPKLAQKMCLQLADFLRYSLSYSQKEMVKVRNEMDHIESYLGVEQIRLGDRFKTKFDIDKQALEEWIPPFSLLPLIENSIKHAIQHSLKPMILSVKITRRKSSLLITVENPFGEEKVHTQKGYGLKLLKRRLANVYKGSARLVISKNNGIFKVIIQVPLVMEKK